MFGRNKKIIELEGFIQGRDTTIRMLEGKNRYQRVKLLEITGKYEALKREVTILKMPHPNF